MQMMTSEQCRLARNWLDWDQKTLAVNAGVGRNTISLFENSKGMPRKATLAAIRHAFEAEGVLFEGGTLVLKQKDQKIRVEGEGYVG